jgi:hypothetical protein
MDTNEKRLVVEATANAAYAAPGYLLFYRELDAGGLAVGMGIEYTPGATRLEVIDMFSRHSGCNVLSAIGRSASRFFRAAGSFGTWSNSPVVHGSRLRAATDGRRRHA